MKIDTMFIDCLKFIDTTGNKQTVYRFPSGGKPDRYDYTFHVGGLTEAQIKERVIDPLEKKYRFMKDVEMANVAYFKKQLPAYNGNLHLFTFKM
jgi:hypothetical protein